LLYSTKQAHRWKETIGAIAILTPLAKQFTWIIPMALKVPVALLNAVVPSLGRIVQLHRVSHLRALKFIILCVILQCLSGLIELICASGYAYGGRCSHPKPLFF
jgi:hypothetical protein